MDKVFAFVYLVLGIISVFIHAYTIAIIATLQGIFWLIVYYGDKLLKD